jgi:hypothetical protein
MDERFQKTSSRLVQHSAVPVTHAGKKSSLLVPVTERSSDPVAAALEVPDIHEALQQSAGGTPAVSAPDDFEDLLLEEEICLLDVYARVSAKRGGSMDQYAEVQATATWIAEKLVKMSATRKQAVLHQD